MSDYIIDLNTNTIQEEYRSSWDNQVIHAIQDPVANLQQFATPFVGEGEYKKFETMGRPEIYRRTGRRQILSDPEQELKLGQRYIFPSMYYSTIGMSKDDLALKGDLPITFETCSSKLNQETPIVIDKAFLGVTYSNKIGNTYIPSTTSKSPYRAGNKKLFADQGLLGVAWIKSDDDEPMTALTLHQQPCLGFGTDAHAATKYTDYDTQSELQLNRKETNVIPVNFVPSGAPALSGLTIEKLIAAKHAAMERGIIRSMNETLNMAITMQQFDDLAHEAQLRNIDFGYQVLKDGVPPVLYGIRFHVTEHVPVVDLGARGDDDHFWVRSCPVWTNDSVRFASWGTPEGYFEKVPNSIDYWRYILTFALGCGRVREEGVISVHCYEAPLEILKTVADPTDPAE